MTEKMPLAKLDGNKIYKSVVRGIMTLRQLAEGYDCSFEQFMAECREKVSQMEWRRILKADAKNQEKANDRKEKEMATAKKPQKNKDQKKQELLEELACVQEKAKISQLVTEDYEGRLEAAEKAVANATRLLKEAQQRYEWTTQNLANSKKADANYAERIRQIQAKLDEFNLYLVAPGYKGEMPRGRLVSVVPFEGYKVTVEEGEDLLNDVSFASMLELGFDTLREANTVLEFAKLVLKYHLEGEDEFIILVDDERVLTVLQGQEVEI